MVRWSEAYRGQHQQLEAARAPGEFIDGYDSERPQLTPYLRWLWNGFQELSGQRGDSFGEVPEAIAVSEMRAHWEWLELGRVCPAREYLYWMRLLDRETRLVFVERAEKKKEKEATE